MNNNSIPPPRPVKQSTNFFSGFNLGNLGNMFGQNSATPSSNNQPNTQIENDSFKYETDIPDILKDEFENLAKAINTKNKILKNYEKLLPALQYLEQLLTKLGAQRIEIANDKSNLESKMAILETERDEIKQNLENINSNRQFGPTRDDFESNELRKKEMSDALTKKDAEIQLIKDKIAELEINSKLNATNIENIRNLVIEATKYINKMKPTDDSNITQIIQLINKMQNDLNANKDAKGYLKVDDNRGSEFTGENPTINRIGGYRYSSSQMRRKSTAKRSSASGSSSSKRRRNKKRTAKKMMLGGKRMKRTKSTKRKHNKKH